MRKLQSKLLSFTTVSKSYIIASYAQRHRRGLLGFEVVDIGRDRETIERSNSNMSKEKLKCLNGGLC